MDSTVEVNGQVDPENVATARSKSERTDTAAGGQHTDNKPRVETTTETKVGAQVMRVGSVRKIKSGCEPTKQ